MKVTVVDREAMNRAWGSPGLYTVITKYVEISDDCPVCGEPRGKPVMIPYCEDGHHYSVDQWNNPCGHVDLYKDVLQEAANIVAKCPRTFSPDADDCVNCKERYSSACGTCA